MKKVWLLCLTVLLLINIIMGDGKLGEVQLEVLYDPLFRKEFSVKHVNHLSAPEFPTS